MKICANALFVPARIPFGLRPCRSLPSGSILWRKLLGRDGKGFAFLAIDSQPNYPDTTALLAAGQSALWKYKAIYRLHDEQVGQWSDVISTTVAG